VIGRQTLQAGGSWGLNWSGRPRVEMSNADRKTLNFQNVNANDITDNLTIRVASVNGTDAETAAINGVLQIRVITKSEANIYDSFSFSRGELKGFANMHAKNPKDLVIPDVIWGDPVLSIGEKAFKNARLTSVVIPNSVASIGEEAFYEENMSEERSLCSIAIGANVAMGSYSFGRIYVSHLKGTTTYKKDFSFPDYYNNNGKTAGIYTYKLSLGSVLASSNEVWHNENAEQKKVESEQKMRPPIRLGVRFSLGGQELDIGSELFDKSYASYGKMATKGDGNYHLTPGLTLGLRIMRNIALATELNYNLTKYSFLYGEKKGKNVAEFAKVSMSYQTIEVPVLLRGQTSFSDIANYYIEAGFQFGFPVSSKVTVSSGSEFPGNPFNDEFSDFRVKKDYGPVFGLGRRGLDFSLGGRVAVPLTKLDRYGTVKAQAIISFTIAYDIF
jgi:hypothetical protein